MGFLASRITKESLERERGVVQNEKRQGENQPYAKAFARVSETLYPAAHPYSWSTIGSMADLDAASLDDVKEWYRTYYGPDNCVLSLAGDITPERALRAGDEVLQRHPAGAAAAPRRAVDPALRRATSAREAEDRVPQAMVYRAYHAPGWRDADARPAGARRQRAERIEERAARSTAGLREEPGDADRAPAPIAARSPAPSRCRRCSSRASIRRWSRRRSTRWSGPSSPKGRRRRSCSGRRAARWRTSSAASKRLGGFGGRADVLAESLTFGGSTRRLPRSPRADGDRHAGAGARPRRCAGSTRRTTRWWSGRSPRSSPARPRSNRQTRAAARRRAGGELPRRAADDAEERAVGRPARAALDADRQRRARRRCRLRGRRPPPRPAWRRSRSTCSTTARRRATPSASSTSSTRSAPASRRATRSTCPSCGCRRCRRTSRPPCSSWPTSC